MLYLAHIPYLSRALVAMSLISLSLCAGSISYDNSWAVVIGINDYSNDRIRNLNYAVNDANGIADMLITHYGFSDENITRVLNSDATAYNIKKSISDIAKKAQKNDRVVIFFAGHGKTEDLPDGGEMGYLVPFEGNPDDLFLSSLPMNTIKTLSERFSARHVLFLIDACYGGLSAISSRGLSTETEGYHDKIFRGKSRQIITAGGRDEEVIEKAEWGHSAFTYNLLRGLRDWMADLDNDGFITAEELAIYLKKNVTTDSGNKQTPTVGRFSTDQGEIMFLRPSQISSIGSIDSGSSELSSIIEENERLRSRIGNTQKQPSVSVAKRLSILYPGLGQLYMGNKKQGILWTGIGTVSLAGLGLGFTNYISKDEAYIEANDRYQSAQADFSSYRDQALSAQSDRNNALVLLAGAGAAYVSVVLFNSLSISNDHNKQSSHSDGSGFRVGIDRSGSIYLRYSF